MEARGDALKVTSAAGGGREGRGALGTPGPGSKDPRRWKGGMRKRKTKFPFVVTVPPDFTIRNQEGREYSLPPFSHFISSSSDQSLDLIELLSFVSGFSFIFFIDLIEFS